jgi:hypothetical protein
VTTEPTNLAATLHLAERALQEVENLLAIAAEQVGAGDGEGRPWT